MTAEAVALTICCWLVASVLFAVVWSLIVGAVRARGQR